jgi:conjugal transfer/type IV secretion protein DotA/TraY
VDAVMAGKNSEGKEVKIEMAKARRWVDEKSKLDCGTTITKEILPAGSVATAADIVKAEMLKNQTTEIQTYESMASGLAAQLASVAHYAADNSNPDYGYIDMALQTFWTAYEGNADAYAAGRSSSIAGSLKDYNRAMGKSLLDEAEKHGWISAPAWLNKIAEQNGKVLDAATVLPAVYGPTAGTDSSSYHNVTSNAAIRGPWNLAMYFISEASRQNTKAIRSDRTGNSVKLVEESFKQILAPSSNPLGKISSYGRKFMNEGLKMTFASSVTAGRICAKPSNAADYQRRGGALDSSGCAVDQFGQVIYQNPGEAPSYNEAVETLNKRFSGYEGFLGGSFGSGDTPRMVEDNLSKQLKMAGDEASASMLRPAGTMLISFGFMAGYVLPLLPFIRFMLGILGWILLLFEAVLAVPLMAISLLKTDGEGFMTQNFQTGAVMILALILRPILMIFGMLIGLLAFNGIMNITNVSFLSAANPDNSLQSVIVYLIIYGILAYTLANSAFKAIDIMPNQVMSWLGARLDQRMDDASVVHQQSAQMVGNIGMVSAMGGGMRMGRQPGGAGLGGKGGTGPAGGEKPPA